MNRLIFICSVLFSYYGFAGFDADNSWAVHVTPFLKVPQQPDETLTLYARTHAVTLQAPVKSTLFSGSIEEMPIQYCRFSVHFSIDHVTQVRGFIGNNTAMNEQLVPNYAVLLPYDALIQSGQIFSMSYIDTVVLGDVHIGEIAHQSKRPVYVVMKNGMENELSLREYIENLQNMGAHIELAIFDPDSGETIGSKVKEIMERNGSTYIDNYEHKQLGWRNSAHTFSVSGTDLERRSHFKKYLDENPQIQFGQTRTLWTEQLYINRMIQQYFVHSRDIFNLSTQLIQFLVKKGDDQLPKMGLYFPSAAIEETLLKLDKFKIDHNITNGISFYFPPDYYSRPAQKWETADEEKDWMTTLLRDGRQKIDSAALKELAGILSRLPLEERLAFIDKAHLPEQQKNSLLCWIYFDEFLNITDQLEKIGLDTDANNLDVMDKLADPLPSVTTRAELEQRQIDLLHTVEQLLPYIFPAVGSDDEFSRFCIKQIVADFKSAVGSFFAEFVFFLSIQVVLESGKGPEFISWNMGKKPGISIDGMSMIQSSRYPFLKALFEILDSRLQDCIKDKERLILRARSVLETSAIRIGS